MKKQNRLSAYRIMWLLVVFDLPVMSKLDRKNYAVFRKDLMRDGFCMMQYSVYIRHCASRERMEAHVRRIRHILPPKGHVSILQITDRQYGNIINFWQKTVKSLPSSPKQLEFF
jgi:CRISPR-associated protein Cas2